MQQWKTEKNGVTIPNSGIIINKTENYATFDGANYISIAHDTVDPNDEIVGTTNKTITCWYRANTPTDNSNILAAYGTTVNDVGRSIGFGLTMSNIAAIAHCGKCDRAIDPADRFDGKWHFLVGVWTGGNKVRFYFDNVAFENTGSYSTTADVLTIGGDNNAANHEVAADIGEVRLYSSALTNAQVEQLYKFGKQTYYSNN